VGKKNNTSFRRQLAWLVFIGLALRAITPAGYMPAPLADGLPFVLCPGGVYGAAHVIASDHEPGGHVHHDSMRGDGGSSGGWESCPFGNAFGAAAPTADTDPVAVFFRPVSLPAQADSFIATSITHPNRARAPPRKPPHA
jgi:hypothetical protein